MTHYARHGDDIDRGLVGYWKLDDLKRVPADGIIAHYKMNDNAANTIVVDSKGSNAGVSANNTNTMDVAGKINNALDFNGTTDNIETTNLISEISTSKNYAVSMWINMDDIVTRQAIIHSSFSVNDRLGIDIINGEIIARGFGGAGNDKSVGGAHGISTGVWFNLILNHHLDNSMELYVNTVLKTVKTKFTLTSSTEKTKFGSRTLGDNLFEGALDDIRIYDKILTSSERASIYNSGSGTETTELFRETVVAVDRANFNDGTITGATNADSQNWKPSNSMSFDGVDDIVLATNIAKINKSSTFTIVAWVKLPSTNIDATIFSNVQSVSDRIVISFLNSSLRGGIYNGTSWFVRKSGSFTSTEWNMLTLTFDGGTDVNLYINLTKQTGSGNPSTGADTGLSIGARTTSNNFFGGLINRLRIYNRVLNQAEISKLFRLRL